MVNKLKDKIKENEKERPKGRELTEPDEIADFLNTWINEKDAEKVKQLTDRKKAITKMLLDLYNNDQKDHLVEGFAESNLSLTDIESLCRDIKQKEDQLKVMGNRPLPGVL